MDPFEAREKIFGDELYDCEACWGGDVSGQGLFYKTKAIRNKATGEVVVAKRVGEWHADIAANLMGEDNRDYGYCLVWSECDGEGRRCHLPDKKFHKTHHSTYERGFIGWDDKYYDTDTLATLADDFTSSKDWEKVKDQPALKVNFSELERNRRRYSSTIARFHKHEWED